ncbi:MAG: DUF4118 domain-containing protein [Chloroflexi bacterium]|nr:MAG: DUF4118 domain-containing protein [Chloroflexota bacterium]
MQAESIRNLIRRGGLAVGGVGREFSLWPILWTLMGILVVTLLHYTTMPGLVRFHAVYRYFYFLPVVYAALRFGFWGGVLSALMAGLLFAPHVFFKWSDFPQESLNDLLVVVALVGVAVITGTTVDRMRAAEAAQAETARRLALSLEKLRAQGEELRRAERLSALATLAGGLAHEIRNPVSIIRATAQLLQAECGPEAMQSLAVIQAESDRIEHLITELVNFATAPPLHRQAVDMAELLRQVGRRMEPVAASRGVTIHVEAPETLPLVYADPEGMAQALGQLVMNAVQAVSTQAKGEVWLRAAWHPGTPYPLLIQVMDNGPGIPPQLHSRIFDPFFTTKDTGTGLGLTMVQRIVQEHGGRIQVTSTIGGGATFSIWLPVGSPTA